MKIQTLVATINQTDTSLPAKMNIQTDALIGNQCGRRGREQIRLHDHKVVFLHSDSIGVGRNRNLLLDQAEAELCVLADDDMRFLDDYPQIALQAFASCPNADVLVFNLVEKIPRRHQNQKTVRLHWYNFGKYGAARLAFRTESLRQSGIRFDLRFGGGARFGSGEDTIFLKSCLKKGLKLYAVPFALAEIDQTAESTWFTGYDEKFFRDKGALYACLYPLLWPLFCLRFLLHYRAKVLKRVSFCRAFVWMCKGSQMLKRIEEDPPCASV